MKSLILLLTASVLVGCNSAAVALTDKDLKDAVAKNAAISAEVVNRADTLTLEQYRIYCAQNAQAWFYTDIYFNRSK